VRFAPELGGYAVETDGRGHTSAQTVFACGDVCGYVGPAAATDAGHGVGEAAAEEALS
jgi:thioredoxin reductase